MSSPSVQSLKIDSPVLSSVEEKRLMDMPLPQMTAHKDCGIYVRDDHRIDKTKLVIPQYYEPLIDYVMITKGEINDRIEKLAMEVYDQFKNDAQPPVLVCLLKGAHTFFEALTRNLRRLSQHRNDLRRPVYIEQFIKASSYNGMSRAEAVELADRGLDGVLRSLQGQRVVLVEDILDSGNTLRKVKDVCLAAGASAVYSAVLFVKRVGASEPPFKVDWAGFSVPNEFVLGFGTDLNEHFRDLDHLCAISNLGRKKYMQSEECSI